MAHFRGTIQGNGNETSRLGTKSSGMIVRINGWDVGLTIAIDHNTRSGDHISIYLTGGSNDDCSSKFVGIYDRRDLDLLIAEDTPPLTGEGSASASAPCEGASLLRIPKDG